MTDAVEDSQAWADFLARLWQRAPGTLHGASPASLCDAASLFRALLEATRQHPEEPSEIAFFVSGEVVKDAMPFLPVIADRDFEGYAARMDRALSGQDFTLLVANPHVYFDGQRATLLKLLDWLFERVGIPAGGVDSSAFVGRYRKTPFGVHRGEMDVMTFPVVGTKTFRTWTSSYAAAHPELAGLRNYPEHLRHSGSIQIAPGDVGYWPSETWHIAESSGEQCTAAWNLGFWWDRPGVVRVVDKIVSRVLDVGSLSQLREHFSQAGQAASGVPKSWREAALAVRDFCESDVLQDELAFEWLRLRSCSGLRKPRPTRESPLSIESPLRRGAPVILWQALSDGLAVAVEGHAFVVAPSAEQHRLLQEVSRCSPGELVSVARTDPNLHSTLALLYRVGALDLAEPLAAQHAETHGGRTATTPLGALE